MAKRDARSGKVLSEPHSETNEGAQHAMHGHERFPTPEELDAFVGKEISTITATDLAMIAYERHLLRTARSDNVTGDEFRPSPHTPGAFSGIQLRQTISVDDARVILVSLRNSRVDHRTLDAAERDRFNNALKLAHQAGTYAPLAAIHTDMSLHRIHSMQGLVGTQRFLPWHRLYLLQCENLLRTYEPSIRVPYWDYAHDHVRPDWVWQPQAVNRGTPGGMGGSLPTQQQVDSIGQNISYTEFTYSLERDAHNQIHNWCNGTVSSPPTAAYDPIFWLLHANVDRIWNIWQMKHNGKPLLKAMDWILDPFALPASDVDSILTLGYWY